MSNLVVSHIPFFKNIYFCYRLCKTISMDITFKPITRDDLPLIEPFLRRQSYRTCDFSIGGIYMWVDFFGYEYAIYQETLFIKGGEEGNLHNIAYAIPIGALPLHNSIEILRSYASTHQHTCILSAIPESAAHEIARLYQVEITELPDWGDYLYSANDLATLAGKRFQKKRNRVNKFKSLYPDYQYEVISAKNLPELRTFFTQYCQENQKDSPLFVYEENMVTQILSEYEALPFEGGVLRVAGKIVAFSIGEVMQDSLIVHIEKGNKEIAGVYEAINQFYTTSMVERHPEVKYINREDDAGDPGLREAKLSYNPIAILKKYNIVLPR